MQLTVTHNFDAVGADLVRIAKQVPFASALALTAAAKVAQAELQAEMRRVFDRPTPFTIGALYVDHATKAQPEARVYFKDFATKGTPAGKYLAAQIEGGPRRQKRSEKALAARGLMGSRGYWVPGSGTRLDAYGNVPGSTITKILSQVQASTDSTQNQMARSAKRRKHSASASSTSHRIGRAALRPASGSASAADGWVSVRRCSSSARSATHPASTSTESASGQPCKRCPPSSIGR